MMKDNKKSQTNQHQQKFKTILLWKIGFAIFAIVVFYVLFRASNDKDKNKNLVSVMKRNPKLCSFVRPKDRRNRKGFQTSLLRSLPERLSSS